MSEGQNVVKQSEGCPECSETEVREREREKSYCISGLGPDGRRGAPHLSKSRVIYTSKPELLFYIWCRYFLTRQQFMVLFG